MLLYGEVGVGVRGRTRECHFGSSPGWTFTKSGLSGYSRFLSFCHSVDMSSRRMLQRHLHADVLRVGVRGVQLLRRGGRRPHLLGGLVRLRPQPLAAALTPLFPRLRGVEYSGLPCPSRGLARDLPRWDAPSSSAGARALALALSESFVKAFLSEYCPSAHCLAEAFP